MRASSHSKRAGKRTTRNGNTRKGVRKSSPIASLRARVWATAFEWARRDLGTDNVTARDIADAGVENL
jgi:hypothetical protein